ncbi:uncharacterized protein LOC111643109 [Copidosoma floridanum]|uniref:uncharacterized protein LOC111643109 n=1 Tax=Copidosoma floridanum TaxID=29053 RepID=UPI000C6F59F6|nr:uncharacterized protein LOC111643109 [Copidosoma floridanum]
MFDMIDLNAEIEKAKSTLGAADSIFQRHALRFDNEVDENDESLTLSQRMERARKVAAQEVPDPKQPTVKWMKLVPVEQPANGEAPAQLQKPRTTLADNPYEGPEPPRRKRSYSKRKKSVSF